MSNNLRIVHILRAPAGGLFRHVRDLVQGQAALGHEIGIVCDSTTGGSLAESTLNDLAQHCSLGVKRIGMARLPGIGDLAASYAVARICGDLQPHLLHGHGAKGGLYARLAARRLETRSFYTPHGGSLHYGWRQPQGVAFLATERALRGLTSGLLFVCDYEKRTFDSKIGIGATPYGVVYNGLWPEEFATVDPAPDATDLVFVGELRRLKGLGDLLTAIAALGRVRPVTLTIVGDGADRAAFENQAGALKIADRVRFLGVMPARQAFPLGRVLVMPSHAESFPYVLLEAAAAGISIIATRVGGIPEVIPSPELVSPRAPEELAGAIGQRLASFETARANALALRNSLTQRFSAASMCAAVTSFYEAVLGIQR
jgi:glycosyltransferase involved in cell wall biosynthesis